MPNNPGETFSKLILFTDADDAAVDPDPIVCTVYDPDGVSQATPTLAKIITGTYELNYNLPADADIGDWRYVVKATIGTYVGIETFYFGVKNA